MNYVELNAFPDANKNWVLAAWSALVSQESETNEALPEYKIKVYQKLWQWQNWNQLQPAGCKTKR